VSRLDLALPTLFDHEGPLSHDQGGLTRWGITHALVDEETHALTIATGKASLTDQELADLSQDQCGTLWRLIVWERLRLFALDSQAAATKVFDIAAPLSSRVAVIVAQRACRACGRTIADDGALGPVTLATLNSLTDTRLLPALRAEAAGEFRLILAKHPEWENDREGWLNRAYE
jgi:lysozyme family protein